MRGINKPKDKFEFGNNILEHERNNYKQTLEEIKDFCEFACPVECRKINCGLCDNIEPFEVIKEIKSIINKL